MATWRHTLKIDDIFGDDGIPFFERRDTIVARIRAAGWYQKAAADEDDGYEISDIVEDLAASACARDFDAAWSNFYDWADSTRIWVEA